MMSQRIVLVLLALVSGCAHGHQNPPRNEGPIAYSWPVKKVHAGFSANPTLQDILRAVPFTAVDIQPADYSPPFVHIDTAGVMGEDVIREYVRQDPRYAAVLEGDWVVIMSTIAVADPDYPLNLIVDHIAARGVSIEQISSSIHLRLKATKGREIYFRQTGGLFGSTDIEHVTLNLSSRTVRSVLLEAAIQASCSLELSITQEKGMTVVNYRPWGMPLGWGAVHPAYNTAPVSIISVLKRRHREGLATPGWHP